MRRVSLGGLQHDAGNFHYRQRPRDDCLSGRDLLPCILGSATVRPSPNTGLHAGKSWAVGRGFPPVILGARRMVPSLEGGSVFFMLALHMVIAYY